MHLFSFLHGFVFVFPENISPEENPPPELDVDHLKSLKDVNEYFASLKESHKKRTTSQKFGWNGPVFVQKNRSKSAKKIVKSKFK